eukprot:Lankesteria_metandrocarpae@DN3454_c1_g1_i1.p1
MVCSSSGVMVCSSSGVMVCSSSGVMVCSSSGAIRKFKRVCGAEVAVMLLLLMLEFVLSAESAIMPDFIASDMISATAWTALVNKQEYGVPLRVILTLSTDHDSISESTQSISEASGVEVQVNILQKVSMAVADFPMGTTFSQVREFIEQTSQRPEVTAVEADSIVGIPPNTMIDRLYRSEDVKNQHQYNIRSNNPITNDPLLQYQWGFNDARVFDAWKVSTGNGTDTDRVRIAVIDSGVDYKHEDLANNCFVNDAEFNGLPGVDDDGNGYVDDMFGWNAISSNGDPRDDHWHGTHCAGTIGAVSNNGIGISGINWSPLIIPCKFLDARGKGTTSDAITCIDYSITVDAVISNNSWGSTASSEALFTAIARSADAGQLFVCAAGNSGKNNDKSPFFPASYMLPNIVAVGSISTAGGMADYSNHGPESVESAAPGSNIVSTVPGGHYGAASGTSMAAPHVAAIAGLAKFKKPDLNLADTLRLMSENSQSFIKQELFMWGGKADAGAYTNAVIEEIDPDVPDPDTFILVLSPSTATCDEVCSWALRHCDDTRQRLLNLDLNLCYEAARAAMPHSYVYKGGAAPQLNDHPVGCYIDFNTRVHIVNLNTSASAEMGCQATAAVALKSNHPCTCVL